MVMTMLDMPVDVHLAISKFLKTSDVVSYQLAHPVLHTALGHELERRRTIADRESFATIWDELLCAVARGDTTHKHHILRELARLKKCGGLSDYLLSDMPDDWYKLPLMLRRPRRPYFYEKHECNDQIADSLFEKNSLDLLLLVFTELYDETYLPPHIALVERLISMMPDERIRTKFGDALGRMRDAFDGIGRSRRRALERFESLVYRFYANGQEAEILIMAINNVYDCMRGDR